MVTCLGGCFFVTRSMRLSKVRPKFVKAVAVMNRACVTASWASKRTATCTTDSCKAVSAAGSRNKPCGDCVTEEASDEANDFHHDDDDVPSPLDDDDALGRDTGRGGTNVVLSIFSRSMSFTYTAMDCKDCVKVKLAAKNSPNSAKSGKA